MDRSDFDFPPDPVADALNAGTSDPTTVLPLHMLPNTAVDKLPPTVVPSEQQQPIRQAMRSLMRTQSRSMRRQVVTRVQADANALLSRRKDANPVTQAVGGVDSLGPSVVSSPSPFPGTQRARFDWTDEELSDFYRFLSQYGTDFNAIAVMYPGRTRDDIKRLYHHELRKRRGEVWGALEIREEIDLSTFRARLKRREELKQAPTRSLDQEEEETLRLIEAGALLAGPTGEMSQNHADETLENHADENADFIFDDTADEVVQSGGASPVEKDPKRFKSEDPDVPTPMFQHGNAESDEDDLTMVELAQRRFCCSSSLPRAYADTSDRLLTDASLDSGDVGRHSAEVLDKAKPTLEDSALSFLQEREKESPGGHNPPLTESALNQVVDGTDSFPGALDDLEGLNEPFDDSFFQ